MALDDGAQLLGPNGYQARVQRREQVDPLMASMWVVPLSSKARKSSYYRQMPVKPTRMAVKCMQQFLYFYKSNTTQPIDFRISLNKLVRVQVPSGNRTVPQEAIPQGAVDVLCTDQSVTLAPDAADLVRGSRVSKLLLGWRSAVQEGEFDVWKKKQGDWMRHTLLLTGSELILTRHGVLDDQKLKCALADIVEINEPSQRLAGKLPAAGLANTLDIRIQQPRRSGGMSTSTMTLRARGGIDSGKGPDSVGGVEEQILDVLLHLGRKNASPLGTTAEGVGEDGAESDDWTSLELDFAPNPGHGLGLVIVRADDGGIEHLKVREHQCSCRVWLQGEFPIVNLLQLSGAAVP